MFRRALADLIGALEAVPPEPEPANVATAELEASVGRFRAGLDQLGRRIAELAARRDFSGPEAAREFFLDSVRGWIDRTSAAPLAEAEMTYAESIRPGVKPAFLAEAAAAAPYLTYEAPPPPSEATLAESLSRGGLAIVAGTVVGAMTSILSSLVLATWLARLAGHAAASAAALVLFTRDPLPARLLPPARRPTTPGPGAIRGWDVVSQRLTSWYADRLLRPTPTLLQTCSSLRTRWNLTKGNP